jgi:hypothetical protein
MDSSFVRDIAKAVSFIGFSGRPARLSIPSAFIVIQVGQVVPVFPRNGFAQGSGYFMVGKIALTSMSLSRPKFRISIARNRSFERSAASFSPASVIGMPVAP